MKFLLNLFVAAFLLSLFSCSSSDNEEILHRLQALDYSDFHHYMGTDTKVVAIDYDTIVEDKSNVMLDTLKIYFSTEIQTTLTDANKIGFSLLQDDVVKYVDYSSGDQIIAKRLSLQDSIFVLQNNKPTDTVFVVRGNSQKYTTFYRTISIYYFKYNGVIKQDVVRYEELDENVLLKKLGLSSVDDLKSGDHLIWANVYYPY